MVLCEAVEWGGEYVFWTWALLTAAGGGLAIGFSSLVFQKCYWAPTYEQWKYKSNPKYPPAVQVRNEVFKTLKCIGLSTICPTISMYCLSQGHLQGFCGWGGRSLTWHVGSFFLQWILCDLFEWGYHNLGHIIPELWRQHKHHHGFHNPSPFAVIADEAYDQIIRSAPMLLMPLLMPTNVDVMYALFTVLFYGYGVYMHAGFELEWPDAHHPIINTSYQHNLHHSVGASGIPAHTGFFLKAWDQLVGADYTKELYNKGKCTCSKCSRERGERSYEAWLKVEKPDYSELLRPGFWVEGLLEEEKKK